MFCIQGQCDLRFKANCLQHLQAQVETRPGIISPFGVKRHEFQRQNGPLCNLCFLHELPNAEARPTGPPAALPMSFVNLLTGVIVWGSGPNDFSKRSYSFGYNGRPGCGPADGRNFTLEARLVRVFAERAQAASTASLGGWGGCAEAPGVLEGKADIRALPPPAQERPPRGNTGCGFWVGRPGWEGVRPGAELPLGHWPHLRPQRSPL